MIDSGIHQGIARLTLNRPEKRNALTPAMLADLAAACRNLAAAFPPADDHGHPDWCAGNFPRAVLLDGAGDVFCAGFDLSLCRDDDRVLADLLTGLSHAARMLRRMPVPVVVSAQGAAIAGGCALLCGADFVVTDRDAKLGYPVAKLGISPAVSAPLLRRGVGDGRARERLLDSGLVSGADALRLGLAHHLVDAPADVHRAATDIARRLADCRPHAAAATKWMLNRLEGSLWDAELDAALAASLALVGSPEQRTRLADLWARR